MTSKRNTLVILAAGLLAAAAVQALSPPPPLPEDALVDFYEAMNGDDWHRNDGWLDPEVDICDWYGITCVTEAPEAGGFEWIGRLELPDNNLRGEFTADLQERMWSQGPATPTVELDLSGNDIEGTLHQLPLDTHTVRLGYNRFEGNLPSIEADTGDVSLETLELNNNGFEGPVPSSWEALSLIRLDVSSNALQGTAEPAFGALSPARAGLIDLSDNAFAGELPAWITELPLEPGSGGLIGSINICWTELSASDPTVRDWLAERHVGGADFESCLQRPRRSIGPRVSGSWFDPERSGEGFSILLLENGIPLVYWFTHLSRSRQMWLVGMGRKEETTLFFPDLLRTHGRFAEGHGSANPPISRKGEQRLDGIEDDHLHWSARINYVTGELAQPDEPIIYAPNPIDWRTDLVRLSELAGTTCDNQSEFQAFSGAWYNPERSGEGFIVEVQPDDQVVVYWFTYEPDDSDHQAWMIGQGNIEVGDTLCTAPGCEAADAVIAINDMTRPVDTGSSFPADLTGVENLGWGELVIAFDDEDTGYVLFDSEFENFGSGDYPIDRLARPKLADCD